MIKSRNINFDLYRLLSMLFICFFHAIGHSGVTSIPTNIINHSWNVLSQNLGSVGDFGFIIISCWFMVDTVKIRSQKIISLVTKSWLISVILLVIFYANHLVDITSGTIHIEILTPIGSSQYWFVTTYLLFYIISPALSKLVNEVSIQTLKNQVIVLSVIETIILFAKGKASGMHLFIYVFWLVALIKRTNWIDSLKSPFLVGGYDYSWRVPLYIWQYSFTWRKNHAVQSINV